MNRQRIGFIGIGNMGGALAKSIASETEYQVNVYDPNSCRMREFSEKFGCTECDSQNNLIDKSDIILFCIKPNVTINLIDNAVDYLWKTKNKERKIFASIAAGVTLEMLNKSSTSRGMEIPFIRIMPNIAVSVNEGLLLLAREKNVKDEEISLLMNILSCCGLCEEVHEKNMEAACPVFSCSPAYVYTFIEDLAYAGVQIGLEYNDAVRYAAQATLGAATAVLRGDKSIGKLKSELYTPGGMTITGINELFKQGFDNAVVQAIIKAYEKQKRLAD